MSAGAVTQFGVNTSSWGASRELKDIAVCALDTYGYIVNNYTGTVRFGTDRPKRLRFVTEQLYLYRWRCRSAHFF